MLLFGAGFAEDDQDGEVDESLAEEAEVGPPAMAASVSLWASAVHDSGARCDAARAALPAGCPRHPSRANARLAPRAVPSRRARSLPAAAVFNPAAHSWIIVPAEEQNAPAGAHALESAPAASQRVGAVEHNLQTENRLLAEIGMLAPVSALSALLPSPAASEIAHLVEGKRTTDAAPAPEREERELPDGVPAWTQALTALDGAMQASSRCKPVVAVVSTARAPASRALDACVRRGAHAGCSRDGGRRGRVPALAVDRAQHALTPALREQSSSDASFVHDVLEHDRASAPRAHAPPGGVGGCSGPGPEQQLSKQAAPPLGLFNNWHDPGWNQWKWLVVTNCATLLLGVYLGAHCASTPCSAASAASVGAASAVSSREGPSPASFRVA